MKTFSALTFLILIFALTSFSQEKKTDEKSNNAANNKTLKSDSSDRKTVKGFIGHLIVVENPRDFIKEWLKPETPKIIPAKEVKFGQSIGAFVLFAVCRQDAQGICNTEVDFAIYKPDGSLLAERKAQPLWKEKAPPIKNTQLGKAILGFSLPKTQPVGEYKVKAKVYDLNADISFELETTFLLKE